MKLSIVVVSYNMARELPRTIRSLSPHMQRGIAASDYEVIVVDNGSTLPFPAEECRRWIPDLRIELMAAATPSPVPAVNRGLELATGELVGVIVDGARMASPGLLATALLAARLHDRPVIGSMTFHLGWSDQMTGSRSGYDAAAEDALLASSGWEEDGYNLFRIATWISMRARSWFDWPVETNAIFLRRDHWRALGGFDSGFVSPGGGLANMDAWGRACIDPGVCVIMLLGEGTFHQVHGGVTSSEAGFLEWWPIFRDEYLRLRGRFLPAPGLPPIVVGRLSRGAQECLERRANPPHQWRR
ncbi:MAG: glycosyltransferase family A protein [Bauldia sp.]